MTTAPAGALALAELEMLFDSEVEAKGERDDCEVQPAAAQEAARITT